MWPDPGNMLRRPHVAVVKAATPETPAGLDDDDAVQVQKRCSRIPSDNGVAIPADVFRWQLQYIDDDVCGSLPKDTSSTSPHSCRGNPLAPTVPANSAVTVPEGVISGNLKRFVTAIPSRRSCDPAL